jgi:hypothetical protein
VSKQDDRTDENGVRFDERETEALRDIVTDWIDEQLVVPPFPAEVTSIIEKLHIGERTEAREIRAPVNLAST